MNITKWLDKIYDIICPYKLKFKAMKEKYINEMDALYGSLLANKRMCDENLAKMKERLDTALKQVKELNKKLKSFSDWYKEPSSKVPEWLNNSGGSYKGRREIREKGKVVSVKINPEDLYFPRPSLIKLVKSNKWEKLPHDEKLKAMWAYVIKRITYRFDAMENWQEPNVTNDLRYGDCEDGTILFVTLARIAGVPADKVFNALGWVYSGDGKKKFGHSFPIAQMSDGKWYIFETTIDIVPSRPMLFAGSRYDASWGVNNWKYDGTIKSSKAFINKVGDAKLIQI